VIFVIDSELHGEGLFIEETSFVMLTGVFHERGERVDEVRDERMVVAIHLPVDYNRLTVVVLEGGRMR
jgi:hypothetical protein